MQQIHKSDIKFKSANGIDTVAGFLYSAKGEKPVAILQIAHGMTEHMARYDDFAKFMVQNGYAVCGNDHLGHGATSGNNTERDGFFADENGADCVIADMKKMNELAREQFADVPLILLGHSMGSFFARVYAATHKNTLDALIISGTSGANPIGKIGLALAKIIGKIKGKYHRSKLLDSMTHMGYFKKISEPKTQYDWLTRDEEIVKAYAKDNKCTFIFTANGFEVLVEILMRANDAKCAQGFNKDMPVYLISGEDDPVGMYGKGVRQVFEATKAAGVKDVEINLYKDCRHELLNETCRKDVYDDVLNWCNNKIIGRQ